MLKIKDNVSIEELRKFILLEITANAFNRGTYIITGICNHEYLNSMDKECFNAKDDLAFELDNGEDYISIYTVENIGNVFIDCPQLQELINQGILIEKV